MARLARDRLQDDRLEVAGDGRVEPPRTGRLAFTDLTQQLARAHVAKGRVEGDQLVERQPQTVDIVLRTGLASKGFRREIPQRANDVA